MSVHSVPPAPVAIDGAPFEGLDHRAVLDELIGMGMDLARMVHRGAQGEAGDDAPGDLAAAVVTFDRIARAVRRTVMLARRLDEPVAGLDAARARALARRRVIRAVEDRVQRDTTPDEGERMSAELAERMDAPELDDELDTRPVEAIVEDICRDLGITLVPGSRAWKRRTPADVAALCARAAKGEGRAGADRGDPRLRGGELLFPSG